MLQPNILNAKYSLEDQTQEEWRKTSAFVLFIIIGSLQQTDTDIKQSDQWKQDDAMTDK